MGKGASANKKKKTIRKKGKQAAERVELRVKPAAKEETEQQEKEKTGEKGRLAEEQSKVGAK